MTLKELRISKNLTQAQAAEICLISLRSYVTFENDLSKTATAKYRYLYDTIERTGVVDETHGILTVEEIQKKCASVFSQYGISYCYLFGSYAKGRATETSDVDLLVSGEVTGLSFYGMTELIRETLNKKVDILDFNQLSDNPELLNEILTSGVKIYG